LKTNRRTFLGGVSAAAALSASGAAYAQKKKYDDGVTDKEIKIGHTNPYSGPASSYGVIGKCEDAYWKSVNERGGINGRMVKFVTMDDGYNPAKTVEVVRQMVEQDRVLCLFNTLGTPTNSAIHRYMNQKKVPQLYVSTGASKWGNYKEFPWTMGFQPDYHTEAVIYAKHILATVKDPKIGVLMQNDDYGKDYWEGFKEGLGKDVNKVVIRAMPLKVIAHNTGSICSIAVAAFVAATERRCSDHSTFMIHPTSMVGQNEGMSWERLQSSLNAALADDQRTENILRERTSLPDEMLSARRVRDVYITPQDALKFGIVHSIAEFTLPRGNEIIQI